MLIQALEKPKIVAMMFMEPLLGATRDVVAVKAIGYDILYQVLYNLLILYSVLQEIHVLFRRVNESRRIGRYVDKTSYAGTKKSILSIRVRLMGV